MEKIRLNDAEKNHDQIFSVLEPVEQHTHVRCLQDRFFLAPTGCVLTTV